VTEGECINSIAFQYGFFWQVVWDAAANAALREKRASPNTLVPGDIVHVPEKRVRLEACVTAQTHTFKMIGVPALFRVQAFDGDQRRANQKYELTIDGVKHSGTSDEDGYLQAPMPPTAKKATLVIGPTRDTYEFSLGQLEPISEIAGVQARLLNLGYDCGEPDGNLNETTKEALSQFQRFSGLKATGEPDDATRAKLVELHDGIHDMPNGEDEQVEEEDDELVPVEVEE